LEEKGIFPFSGVLKPNKNAAKNKSAEHSKVPGAQSNKPFAAA